MKHLVLSFIFLFASAAHSVSEAGGAIPLRVVPASQAYCVDKFRFDLKSRNLDNLFKLFASLRPVLEEIDASILFADWRSAKTLQILQPISCEESVDYSNTILSVISKVMTLETGGHERASSSPYVMTEYEYQEIKGITDLFSFQSKYTIIDCVASINPEYAATDIPLRLERSMNLAHQIIGAQAHLGFPVLFVNVEDGNTYVLFHEGCQQRIDLLHNFLSYLSLKNNDTKVHDLIVRETEDEDLIMRLFY